MSEGMLWPEERNKGTSQMHGEDQQKNIKHGRSHTTPSTAAETKLAWHFTKSHQVVSTQKMLFTHHRKTNNKKKKRSNSRNTVPLTQSWSTKKKLVPEDQMLQKMTLNWMHDSTTTEHVSRRTQLTTDEHERPERTCTQTGNILSSM